MTCRPRSTVEQQAVELADMCSSLAQLKDAVHFKFVICDKYQKWHVAPRFTGVAILEWKARCGWRDGRSKLERRSKAPAVWGVDEKAHAALICKTSAWIRNERPDSPLT